MKSKTKAKLLKVIGELETIQNELEIQKEHGDYDTVGDCVNTLTELLAD